MESNSNPGAADRVGRRTKPFAWGPAAACRLTDPGGGPGSSPSPCRRRREKRAGRAGAWRGAPGADAEEPPNLPATRWRHLVRDDLRARPGWGPARRPMTSAWWSTGGGRAQPPAHRLPAPGPLREEAERTGEGRGSRTMRRRPPTRSSSARAFSRCGCESGGRPGRHARPAPPCRLRPCPRAPRPVGVRRQILGAPGGQGGATRRRTDDDGEAVSEPGSPRGAPGWAAVG